MTRSNYFLCILQVPLSEVFRNEKVSLGGNIYQRCSLKVPAFSPMLSQITCAFICCTLTLEDQGPPPLEKKAVPVQSEGDMNICCYYVEF